MTLIEFAAFIISILALIFLMGRRAREERKRLKDPEVYKQQLKEREKLLKDLFQTLEVEEEEEVIPEPEPESIPQQKPLPAPIRRRPPTRKGYEFTTSFKDYETHTAIEDRYIGTRVSDETIHIAEEPIMSLDMTFTDKRPYEIIKETEQSRLHQEIEELPSLRKMLIYHEVFSRPKALRPTESHEFPLSE